MKVLELIQFIKSRVPFTYYPNAFPADGVNTPDECAVVTLTGGFPVDELGKRQPSFQIRVRAKKYDDATAEAKAYEIFDSLTNLENVTIGDDSIVIIRPLNSNPMFLGTDDNGRPIYSMNFSCAVRP
ncbi:MAG: hypothetical protein IRZ03_14525 [Acidobacterium ailaaui]|nr:hypothetical protein [Pseudacidobacterium ailaaui]